MLGHSDAPIAVVENEHLLAKVLEMRAQLPALRCVVLMQGSGAGGGALAISLLERRTPARARRLGAGRNRAGQRSDAVQPSDVATLVYTSGTTGPPKAVMATHGNLIAAINALGPIVDLSTDDRVLSYLPLAHILERLNSEVRLYSAGNAIWFAASIAELPAELRDIRPTCFVGVPRVWEKMAATIEAAIDAMPPGAPPPGPVGDRRRGTGRRRAAAKRAGDVDAAVAPLGCGSPGPATDPRADRSRPGAHA